MEIVPGPANIGMANGVKDTSERVAISSFTLDFFIPLCSENFPVNKANPDDVIINPPAIFKEVKLIPKNDMIYFPAKKERNKMIKILNAVQNAVFALS